MILVQLLVTRLRGLLVCLTALAKTFVAKLSSAKSVFADGDNSTNTNSSGQTKSDVRAIPGPAALPVFGASWLYSSLGPYTMEQYHVSNDDKYRRFGPVVREEVLWNFPLIHLFDKSDIERVLRHPSDFPLRPPNVADVYYRRYRKEFYRNDGMVNLNGPEWHSLRAMLTPPLTNRNTPKHYAGHMNLIAEDFVQLVGQQRDADDVVADFRDLVYRAGLETVSNVALERRMGFLDNEINVDTKLILDSIQGYQKSSSEAMYGLPFWQYVPKCFSGVFTNLVKHKDNLLVNIGKIVDETLKESDAEESRSRNVESGEFEEERSILKLLLKNPELHLADIKASVVDYITAGVDTIGNSIVFVMALLAQHPEVQRKLQQEIDSKLAPGEEVTPEKILELKYLRACVTESFRMLPTASQIARILEEDTPVSGGFVLPKYSVVLCHHRIAALHEDNFSRAAEFLPERWMDETKADFARCEPGLVLPFGIGKRACPGKRLAEQEIYIMVAKMFQAFDVTLVGQFELEFNWLLTPASGLKLKVKERCHA